jgi:hypothetical protein
MARNTSTDPTRHASAEGAPHSHAAWCSFGVFIQWSWPVKPSIAARDSHKLTVMNSARR